MSTPLLSPYQFAVAAHSLGHHASEGRTMKSCAMLAGQLCRALTVEVFGCDDGLPEAAAQTLIFDLQRTNANAYATRYSKRTPKVQPLTLDPDTEPLTPIALLKCLQCVRYNCDCGESIGEGFRPALTTLGAVINVLRDHVIDQLPEYNKAEWFIDSPSHTI